MTDYTKWNTFLAIDLGYGDVKLALKKEDGTLMIAKFPSAVAKVNPKRFGAGEAVEFEGDHYLIGENAINYKPVEMNDYETLERYSPLLVFHAFRKYGEFDTIVTGLSIRQEDQSGDFKDRLSNFVIDGTEYNLDVKLLPQGIGAKVVAEKQFADISNYLVCDGGFNTVDLVPVFDGKADIHSVDALENRGIIEVINELIDYISGEYNIELTPKEAKFALDNEKIEIYGKEIDLSEEIAHITTDYSRDLVRQIERKFKKSWHKFQKVIIVGGLSHFVDPTVYEHLATVPKGEYYNAVGFQQYATDKLGGDEAPKKPKVTRRRVGKL
jgi:hypothetical protein